MAKTLIVLEEAWVDVDEASDYYEAISTGLRKRFEKEFLLFLEKLETGIVSFKLYKQKYRRVNMLSFPLKIYYKEDISTVVIVAVIHAARGNRFLKQRLL